MARPNNEVLKEIPAPANGWYSLSVLLEHYTPGTLADAIDTHGIYVVDRFGRRVPATDGLANDYMSKARALSLLADRYEELENPGPQYSWEAERWDTEPHPTYYYGWQAENLPNFDSIGRFKTSGLVEGSPKDWTQRSAKEFIEEKNRLGSFEAAGKLHGVTRQRYTEVFNKKVSPEK